MLMYERTSKDRKKESLVGCSMCRPLGLRRNFFLMSVRLYCFINFWEWPRNSRAGCLKYMLAGVLYWLWTNLYVSTQSVNFLLLSSESNSISFEQSWRHFLCTFSNLSMSSLYHGFHTGDAYSRAGLIIDWYNVVTFFSVKFVKHRFIIPIFWYAFFVIISMCVAGLRVLDIVTPRSFWLSTLSRLTPSRVYILSNSLAYPQNYTF